MSKLVKGLLVMLIILAVVAAIFLFEGDLPASVVDAKYSNSESEFLIMENGSRVHYRDQGNASGLPVVLVHGAMASLHTWEPWVSILGQKYRIVTLDLPAHGLTGQVPSGEYGGDVFTQTIDAVANAAGLKDFVLGGNSMGGGATWRYALEHPERVSAMILVDSVAPRSWQSSSINIDEEGGTQYAREAPAAFALLQQEWFRAIARYLDPASLIGQGLRSAYNDSPVVDEQLIERYYELIMREGTRAAILSRTGSYGDSDQLTDFSALTQPSLIMWGGQDAVIPVSVAPLFEKNMPNTVTVIYPDLGHIPMEENPALTAADVLKFLDSLQAK